MSRLWNSTEDDGVSKEGKLQSSLHANESNNSGTSPRPSTIECLVAFVIIMSMYAFIRLSSRGLIVGIVVLSILESIRLVKMYRTSTKLDIGSDLVFFAVLLSLGLGSFRALISYPTFLVATILYRPEYLSHGNRQLAFVLSLLIFGVVMPVTFGLATASGVISGLGTAYLVLVLVMWLCCSKIGLALFNQSVA